MECLRDVPELFRPVQLCFGRPNAGDHTVKTGRLVGKDVVVIASLDVVTVLDNSLRPLYALDFCEAFPTGRGKGWSIGAVCIDSETNKVAASCGQYVGIWIFRTFGSPRIESSFSAGHEVTSIDLRDRKLALGGSYLSLWLLDDSASIATWTKKWNRPCRMGVLTVALSPCLTLLASSFKDHNIVHIWRLDAEAQASTASAPWHPHDVIHIGWKPGNDSSGAILLTQTLDGIFRIWSAVIDDPHYFSLWVTLSHVPWPERRPSTVPIRSVWLDTSITREEHDAVLTVFSDGSLGLNTVKVGRAHLPGTNAYAVAQHVGTKPPKTIKQSFSLLYPRALAREAQLCTRRLCILASNPPRLSLLGFSNKGTACLIEVDVDYRNAISTSPQIRYWRRLLSQMPRRIVKSPDACHFFTADGTGNLTGWKARRSGDHILRFEANSSWEGKARCDAMATSDDGEMLATLADDRIELYERSGRHWIEKASTRCADALHVSFVANTSLIIVCRSGGTQLWNWQLASMAITSNLETMPVDVLRVPRTDDNATLAIRSREGQISIWSLVNNKDWRLQQRIKKALERVRLWCCSASRNLAIGEHGANSEDLQSSNNQTCRQVEMNNERDTLTIWDTIESEFTLGLEFTLELGCDETITSLDWHTTADDTSVLLVALKTRVVAFCSQRRQHTDNTPIWIPISSVDLKKYAPTNIVQCSWTWGGSFLVFAGNQCLLFSIDVGQMFRNQEVLSLDRLVHTLNGPLPVYHPQLLLHTLLAGKFKVVENIFRGLAQELEVVSHREFDVLLEDWPIADFLGEDVWEHRQSRTVGHSYEALNNGPIVERSNDFTKADAQIVLTSCSSRSLPLLNKEEHEYLDVLCRTFLEVKEQQRSLDPNGMRYLISMRSYFFSHRQHQTTIPQAVSTVTGSLPRLRFRDVLWAFHSHSQDILLQTSMSACNSKMLWAEARALGVFLWLKSRDAILSTMEHIARTAYTAGEDRDPVTASLFYFALRKRRLVLGLWKQASGHSDRNNMLSFLTNDFDEPRWRTAARRNAFVLMSKQRFDFAVAFFLLGDALRDAINVCLKQLSDFQLAIALARTYEGDSGPTLRFILESHVIPHAFARGFRWLASWAFWMLDRRDLAVRVIVTPFAELEPSLSHHVTEISSYIDEDPTLAMLLAQLRDWSLQTIKGASLISSHTEFHFILYMARVLRRLGCHVLALDLVQSWPFTYPSPVHIQPIDGIVKNTANFNGHSDLNSPKRSRSFDSDATPGRRRSFDSDIPSTEGPTSSRRSSSARRRSSFLGRRKSSIIVDVEVPSTVVSRAPSPSRQTPPKLLEHDENRVFNSFLKEAKQVKVGTVQPAADVVTDRSEKDVPSFDLGAFGF